MADFLLHSKQIILVTVERMVLCHINESHADRFTIFTIFTFFIHVANFRRRFKIPANNICVFSFTESHVKQLNFPLEITYTISTKVSSQTRQNIYPNIFTISAIPQCTYYVPYQIILCFK